MQIITVGLTLVLFFGSSSICFCEHTESKRVLFLGNSEFYSRGGLYPSFEGFSQAAGLNFQAISQWKPPANPIGVEFLNFGRIPVNLPEIAANKDIHALIRSGNFDYVVLAGKRSGYLLPDWVDLPDHRGQQIPYEKNLEALAEMHRTIVESGARMVFYMEPGWHATLDIKHPLAQVYQRLHTDLEKMEINGEKHKVILVPAMLLWIDALRRFGVEGWYVDPAHGNALARYASACLLYTYLTGNDPRENDFNKLTELTRSWEIIPEKPKSLQEMRTQSGSRTKSGFIIPQGRSDEEFTANKSVEPTVNLA